MLVMLQRLTTVLSDYETAESSTMKSLIPLLWPANLISGTSLNAVQNPAPEFGYSYNGVMKVDHTFNQKHNLSARAFLGQGNQTAPVGQRTSTRSTSKSAPSTSITIRWPTTGRFTPSLTNSVTIGVNYFHQTFSDAKTDFGACQRLDS